MASTATGSIRLKLTNSLPVARQVILEPWTGRCPLEPGQSFVIVAEGDMTEELEIELFDETVTVYALNSEGAMLTILQDGVEIPRSEYNASTGLS